MPDQTDPQQTNTTEPPATDPFEQARAEARQAALAEADAIYRPAVLDAERRATEAANKLNELSQQRSTPAAPVPSSDWFTDPETNTRRTIREELAQAVAPLNALAEETRNANAYGMIKSQIRVDPRFAPHFATIEPYLDQEVRFLNPLNLNSVGMLAVNILGRIAIGAINAPAVPRTPAPPAIPSAPPSAPPPPRTTVSLTEEQRRVARIWGMTDEQYVAYTNSDGSIDAIRGIK